jgi:hypothetical protein
MDSILQQSHANARNAINASENARNEQHKKAFLREDEQAAKSFVLRKMSVMFVGTYTTTTMTRKDASRVLHCPMRKVTEILSRLLSTNPWPTSS